jgi:hypothetical protein
MADSRFEEALMRADSNVLSVQTTQPQGKEVVTCALDSIAEQRHHSQHNVTSLGIVQWESCLDKQSCHVSESLSITTFAGCPVPWSNDTTNKVECQELQRQWLCARESIQTEFRRSDSQSA